MKTINIELNLGDLFEIRQALEMKVEHHLRMDSDNTTYQRNCIENIVTTYNKINNTINEIE